MQAVPKPDPTTLPVLSLTRIFTCPSKTLARPETVRGELIVASRLGDVTSIPNNPDSVSLKEDEVVASFVGEGEGSVVGDMMTLGVGVGVPIDG